MNSLENKVDTLIESHKRNNKSFIQNLYGLFINIKYSGPVAAFALIGIFIFPSFLQEETNQDSIYTFDVNIERSNSTDIETIFAEKIELMVQMNINEAIIIFDKEEEVNVYISPKKIDKCLEGT